MRVRLLVAQCFTRGCDGDEEEARAGSGDGENPYEQRRWVYGWVYV